ncbi:aspartate aminotransferase family protein [Candidatus Harpocratesius sp.]
MVLGYAITEYPNTAEIYAKMNQLLKLPLYKVNAAKMKQYLNFFEHNCSRSKAIITDAKQYIPGGVQHNLAFNYPFPLVIEKANGAYLYDVDGNQYIDFLQAGGPTLLGNNYVPVREKVIEVIQECAPVTGLFHEFELKLAKEIHHHMPAVEMFRMLGSGTEGDMAAIRIARLATKRKKIIKLGGAYHGWSDQLIYGIHLPGTKRFEAHGIPASCSRHTQEVFPNDIHALERQLRLNKFQGGTAAVLLEPVGPESGTRPIDKEYIHQARELCDKYDSLLIFDEVVTAFRLGMGGAQGYFKIKPDLTVFGKIVAGGYPGAGGVGGQADLISFLAAGVETGKKRAYVGGTLSANPLSTAAGYYSIKEIERTDAAVKAGQAGDKLTKGLKKIINDLNLPFVAYNQGSICHLETVGAMFLNLNYLKIFKILKEIKERKFAMEEYGAAYMAEGMITLAGSRLYTSMADTSEIIDDALSKFERVFQNIQIP